MSLDFFLNGLFYDLPKPILMHINYVDNLVFSRIKRSINPNDTLLGSKHTGA